MANVKRRLKAPKNATRKKRADGRTKKSLKSIEAVIDIESKSESNETQQSIVMKRPASTNLFYMTPEEKVQCLLQNGHLLKDKFKTKSTLKTGTSKEIESSTVQPQPTATENDLPTRTIRKSVRLKSQLKYLEIMDNLLQNEYGEIPNKRSKTASSNGVNNNNDSEITNQNNESADPNKRKDSTSVVEATSNKCNIPSYLDDSSVPSPPLVRRRGRPKKDYTRQAIELEIPDELVFRLSLFVCDYCEKTFARKHSLVRHIYLHLGRKPHVCPVCPKKFRILKNMKNHIDRDHCVDAVDENAKTFACEICNKQFLTEENLKLHLTSHVKGENVFKCIYCDKKFAYQLLLVQHEKKHLVTGKYQCTLCDMKYNSRDKLYVHVKGHLKLADFICQYCGREFLRANSMKRHVATMHAGRTIQCPICNKNLKGHLTEHMRTHDKKRPHKCPECGKHFAQSTQMQVHRRGHTGARPYMCRICERPFSHSNALMLHLRRHTGEKPFPCAECPLSFSQLPHMKAHMFKIHGKVNPYKCLKCEDYFKLKKDLLVHKKKCTGTGIDTDLYGDNGEDSPQNVDSEVAPVESTMTLSRMRFLLALLLTMIASKEKLKYLGFNKRLVDDLLVESLEAMDQIPCRDETISPLMRLKKNIETLLTGTVPKEQMEKFRKEKKSTEELLELLTSEKDK
ncbi:uncharacterized protein LOC142978256 isoform X2 [Anticarsia gemmatalis]|uniref:uncharacterized protein LOC142978256 isoform X2 n=1 Tax=Anticarsia gemmatalis TaxID=129554 RepID=UPI003F7642A5